MALPITDLGGPQFANWLPDETLFSLASRIHRISGNRLASTTCQALFGHTRQGSAHDLPCRVDAFVERTRGEFGGTEEIIRARTVLPYFLPFHPPEQARNAIACMRGDGIGSLKFQLGLLTSRFRAHLPLKACPQCMAADRQQFHISYWHREHQLPGVWVCRAHDAALLESTMKSTGAERFGWHLPTTDTLRHPDKTEHQFRDRARTNLARIADASAALCTLDPDFAFDKERLREVYREALMSRSLASATGRLRLAEIGDAYLEFTSDLMLIPELASIAPSPQTAGNQVANLIYRTAAVTHPLRHVLAIAWLFPDWAAFLHRYQTAGTARHDQEKPSTLGEPDVRRQRLIELVDRDQTSVTAAARILDIAVGTAMSWLAAAGLQNQRRPKTLRGERREVLISVLKRGEDKQSAAHAAGVSVSTITRVLLTEPGLHESWVEARATSRMKAERTRWSKLLQKNPRSPIPLLRSTCPATYSWLYRNDRVWLAEVNSRHHGPASPTGRRVDWDARDEALSMEVRRAALELVTSGVRSPIAIWRLCQALPELKSKLSALDRLPRTGQALVELTRSRRQLSNDPIF